MKTISGFWAGVYAYPNEPVPSVKFDCELSQNGSVLSGTLTESHAPGQMLAAQLSGQISGLKIQFVKSYVNAGNIWQIAYSGQINAEKTHITGMWRVGMRTGTFEMHRDPGHRANVEIERAEDGPL